MQNNSIVSIGDILLALPKYHETYALYMWSFYTDFIIGEVISVQKSSFGLRPIEKEHTEMFFNADWIVPIGNYLPYFQKIYAKQS